MTADQLLNKFYMAYAQWLREGAIDTDPNGRLFFRTAGVRGNLMAYATSLEQVQLGWDAIAVLVEQYKAAGLNPVFPFNDPGSVTDNLAAEIERHECHINEARLEWVFGKEWEYLDYCNNFGYGDRA